MMEHQLASVEALIEQIQKGRPVILVDDEGRENEGDLILPAQRVTPQLIGFMIRHTGGVLCLAMDDAMADRLELPPMVQHNTARLQTAFTVSIEAKEGVGTGISAADRATTIQTAVKDGARPEELARPGHVFPLRARAGGVLRRAGHTEAAVDLCRLAGQKPAAVLSEMMHDDGSMMRLSALLEFGRAHDIPVGSIASLIAYRMAQGGFVSAVGSAALPTPLGDFEIFGFSDELSGSQHVALIMGDLSGPEPALVRMHSECLTGDVLHSLRCDCGAQRETALEMIADEGRGALVYLRQEGRGIGLLNKIKAYALQDQGLDTVEANAALGLQPDLRDYGVGAQILNHLGVRKMRLMTNNPRKIAALKGFGLQVVERVPIVVGHNAHNARYMQVKASRLGHLISL